MTRSTISAQANDHYTTWVWSLVAAFLIVVVTISHVIDWHDEQVAHRACVMREVNNGVAPVFAEYYCERERYVCENDPLKLTPGC